MRLSVKISEEREVTPYIIQPSIIDAVSVSVSPRSKLDITLSLQLASIMDLNDLPENSLYNAVAGPSSIPLNSSLFLLPPGP
jgi:hypothetical protein